MAKAKTSALAPGAVIGILGGGQLGRMTALAAAQMGYRCHILCPDAEAPACQVTTLKTVADYRDEAALDSFAKAVDVVTLEFENIPIETAEYLAPNVTLHPSPKVLHTCQNRLREKDFCNDNKVPTTRYAEVTGREALARVARDIGFPAVLKTVELGYDGKGQALIASDAGLATAWDTFTKAVAPDDDEQAHGILESYVDFRLEISVIVARGIDGSTRTYPPVENQHKDHILDQTIVPARISTRVADRAEAIARHVAEKAGLVGLMAIEMFVTTEDEVLVNELAPRPHNSGHWTIDACVTSQFEQVVRAVTGLPLGACELLSDAVMKNLLGDDAERWPEILTDPMAKLHLYGKAESRPGRKMGHVTRLILRT